MLHIHAEAVEHYAAQIMQAYGGESKAPLYHPKKSDIGILWHIIGITWAAFCTIEAF